MKIKTSELEGAALDWAVWKIEHAGAKTDDELIAALSPFSPSTNWAQGGPIIEQMMLDSGLVLQRNANHRKKETCCVASLDSPVGFYFGPAPLIAVMRCYVASKLGNEVEIPEELLK